MYRLNDNNINILILYNTYEYIRSKPKLCIVGFLVS